MKRGFTLIELLVVIAITCITLVVVIDGIKSHKENQLKNTGCLEESWCN